MVEEATHLDRVLCNKDEHIHFPIASIIHLPGVFSYYFPLLLRLNVPCTLSGQCGFHFQAVCCNLYLEKWVYFVYCFASSVLLDEWNGNVFENVD